MGDVLFAIRPGRSGGGGDDSTTTDGGGGGAAAGAVSLLGLSFEEVTEKVKNLRRHSLIRSTTRHISNPSSSFFLCCLNGIHVLLVVARGATFHVNLQATSASQLSLGQKQHRLYRQKWPWQWEQ